MGVGDFVALVFGGDSPHFPLTTYQVAARAAMVYVLGVAAVRMGKSRLLSRATPLDVILALILGSLLSRGITGHASLSNTIVASVVLVALHWLLTALGYRFPGFEDTIKGRAYPLVEQGRQRGDNMRRSHVSRDDLTEAMRLQGIGDFAQIESAFKERNGEVSVIKRPAPPA